MEHSKLVAFLWIQAAYTLGNFLEIVWRHKKSQYGWAGGTKKYIGRYWKACVLPTVGLGVLINVLWQYGDLNVTVVAEKWINDTLGIQDVGAMVVSLLVGIVASHFLNTDHMQRKQPHDREGRTS